VEVYGGHAYLATTRELTVVDLAVLDTPTEVGWAELEESDGESALPNDVEVEGGVAYLAVGDDRDRAPGKGLRTHDITDPTAPTPLGGIDTADVALDVELAAGFALVAAGTDGLRVFDVADPSAPAAAGALALPGSTAKLEVVGTTAYVVDRGIRREQSRALRVVDVSNAAAPSELGAVELPDSTRVCEIPGISVDRQLAYVTCSGLYVIDVSDPAQPTVIAVDQSTLIRDESSIHVAGDRAYIGINRLAPLLLVYDVSDPTLPVMIHRATGGGRAIVVEGGFAYSAGEPGLSVHDLTGPEPALLMGGYPSLRGHWNGLAIANGLVFGGTAFNTSGGLEVIDLGPEYTRYTPARSVEIAIRAAGEPAVINLASRGVIGVAILAAADFDVARIDRSTLRFGPASAAPAHKAGGHLEDVNGDTKLDLISHYRIADTGFSEADEEACVSGQTSDGTPIKGCDTLGVMLPRGKATASSVAD
jgi:hypothetical protein